MTTYRIRIIAPVATDAFNARILEAVQPVLPPDVQVDVRNIEAGHPCIESRWNLSQNAPGVVRLAKETEQEGYHGIFVTDFDMCGVEACREIVDIPVVGGFVPCAFTALALSQRFSIVTVLPGTVGMQLDHIRHYGLSESFASIRAIDCPVDQLSDLDVVAGRVFDEGLKAIREDGAQSLLLGCTGFIGIAARVQTLLSDVLGTFVPVIDPNEASFGFLVSLVRSGLRPSRITYAKATMDEEKLSASAD